ncbi:MAG: DHH family phosphoesterase [Gemmatimonadota bacterium]|nr:MAG: DHH family phosphoesterase [Gemmatimonadota bacterium]
MKITEMSRTRLRRLLKAFAGVERALVLTHDYPDPDAVASALALQRLLERRIKGCHVDIGYGGIVGRAENRAMVKAVKANIQPLADLDFSSYQGTALVDTQPRTGNNSFPSGKRPTVVLDHHPVRRETRQVQFYDVRTRFGATATMMYEYLKAARFRLDPDLATALFYGIRAETQALTREAGTADRAAYVALLPQVAFRKIYDIEYAGVPREYFGQMGTALARTTLFGDVAFTWLGEIPNPDFCAEFCDMILRLETTRWALCVGHKDGLLYLSLRTRERSGHAGRTIARVVGREGKAGGHGMMAGGIAYLEKFEDPTCEAALELLRARYLDETKATDRIGEPLLTVPDIALETVAEATAP